MTEYCRFFSDHANKKSIGVSETPFGQRLARQGLGGKAIIKLAKNPLLEDGGGSNYAFNLTEEKDSEIAAEILGKVTGRSTIPT
jgi:hypothetical protein